jgi:hypothetical protein
MGVCLWQAMHRMTLLHFSLPKMFSICFFGFVSCLGFIGEHIRIGAEG